METIAKIIIDNASAETLREIFSHIDETVINGAIAASMGYCGPAFAGARTVDVDKTQEELKESNLLDIVSLIKNNCAMELSRNDDITGLVISVNSMRKREIAKIEAIRWIRAQTNCSLKDAKFAVDMIYDAN